MKIKVRLFKADSPDALTELLDQWLEDGDGPSEIVDVQQYIVGQVSPTRTVRMSGEPAVSYSFCLLIFYKEPDPPQVNLPDFDV